MKISIQDERLKLYGAKGRKPLRRIPNEIMETFHPELIAQAKHASGIRIRFATDSPYLTLNVEYGEMPFFHHFALSGLAGFDLYEEFNGDEDTPIWKIDVQQTDGLTMRWLHNFTIPGDIYETKKCSMTWEQVEPGLHHYTLYFPLYAEVTDFSLEIADDAVLEPHEHPYINDKPYIFYGSSITEGACASKPSNTYQGILSRTYNIDYVNLGFSGNAKGEQEMARYIASCEQAGFIMDYDYNAPDAAWLERTHEAFFQTIRDAQPDLPIYILTACSIPRTEAEAKSARDRRKVIKETYEHAKAKGDQNVYFLDMTPCYYGNCAQGYTIDGVHPNDLGFMQMAKWIGRLIFKS